MEKRNIENKKQMHLFLESGRDVSCGNCGITLSESDKSLAMITTKCPHCETEIKSVYMN